MADDSAKNPSQNRSTTREASLPEATNQLAAIFEKREREIVDEWLEQQAAARKLTAAEKEDTRRQSVEFVHLLRDALLRKRTDDIMGPDWTAARDFLADLSARRAKDGYSPSETASFIFSLKKPIFAALRQEYPNDAAKLADEIWFTTVVLDKLGLLTAEGYQKTREDVILRMQKEVMELSTPVVRLWENVLALPLIGTLDSSRTQVVMQNLLEAIVETRSDFAIIDITGVPVVDTLVAQHLLKTVAAARLMGADCLISGIRPQIAQTIIHLGVDLSEVTTKATLADAFEVALKRGGQTVVRQAAAPNAAR
jgi:rsbT co-antagonist protein RsbR